MVFTVTPAGDTRLSQRWQRAEAAIAAVGNNPTEADSWMLRDCATELRRLALEINNIAFQYEEVCAAKQKECWEPTPQDDC